MKKLLFLIFIFGASIMNACPSCIGYDDQRKLRRQPIDIQKCNCDCQRQYHTTPADNDKKGGHWCRMCQHRYIPTDPLLNSKIPEFLNPQLSDLTK